MAKRDRIYCLSKQWEKSYKKADKAKYRRQGKRDAKES
jgi:hypothetical protein